MTFFVDIDPRREKLRLIQWHYRHYLAMATEAMSHLLSCKCEICMDFYSDVDVFFTTCWITGEELK